MQGKTPYVELSDGDAKQTNSMYKCNGKRIRGFNVIHVGQVHMGHIVYLLVNLKIYLKKIKKERV